MSDGRRPALSRAADHSLRAAAFDLSPEPAMVVGPDGSLAAANEAAEALFGQGLGLLRQGLGIDHVGGFRDQIARQEDSLGDAVERRIAAFVRHAAVRWPMGVGDCSECR